MRKYYGAIVSKATSNQLHIFLCFFRKIAEKMQGYNQKYIHDGC